MSLVNKTLGDPMEPAKPDSATAPPNRRRIAANFITLASTGVLGLIVTILISIYVRRTLGPAAIGQVSWALAGEPRGSDERMLELLEPYRGQRGRAIRLLETSGIAAPRYGPRLTPRSIAAI